YQRTIVAPTPGTTRDLVSVEIAADGWPIELIDSAGLRGAAETLEAEGIDLARSAVATADLCLWVVDTTAQPMWPDPAVARTRLIFNKIDLPSAWDLDDSMNAILVSAQTGDGIARLVHELARELVPETPKAGAAVPFTPELCACIDAAAQHLGAGRTNE